jgi:hypothetical protein
MIDDWQRLWRIEETRSLQSLRQAFAANSRLQRTALARHRCTGALCGKVAYARFGLGDEMQTSAFGQERSVDLKSY